MNRRPSDPVRLRAHAKLTLSLRVVAKRSDGYHDIEATMVSLRSPHDRVEVTLDSDPAVALEIDGRTDAVPVDDSNLAARAAEHLLRSVEPRVGARIGLWKDIPAGAGLGGGSADAAAVLRAIETLLPSQTAAVDLVDLASELGADVPFCLTGGAVRVSGKGDVLDALEPVRGCWVVVAVPPVRIDTATAYRAWDELGSPRASRSVATPPALSAIVPALSNDLEPAALAIAPGLERFRDRLEEAAGVTPVLAGSGAAWFVVTPSEDVATEVAGAITTSMPELRRSAALVAVTDTVSAGVTPAEPGRRG